MARTKLCKFASYTHLDRYMVCLTAGLLNRLTLGQNPVFAKYVDKLKEVAMGMRRSNEMIERFFGIGKFEAKKMMEEEKRVEIAQIAEKIEQKTAV